jgi:hypothetical protein
MNNKYAEIIGCSKEIIDNINKQILSRKTKLQQPNDASNLLYNIMPNIGQTFWAYLEEPWNFRSALFMWRNGNLHPKVVQS